MLLREIIEADKNVTDYGGWRRGKIPAAAFPIHKQRRLNQSSDWLWRVIRFCAIGNEFSVLIRLNQGIQEYYAYLAHIRKDGYAIICSHDLHTSHKNWHCHFVKGDVTRTYAGYLRDKHNMIYFPSGGREIECTTAFEITQQNALIFAARRFRFEEPPQGELIL